MSKNKNLKKIFCCLLFLSRFHPLLKTKHTSNTSRTRKHTHFNAAHKMSVATPPLVPVTSKLFDQSVSPYPVKASPDAISQLQTACSSAQPSQLAVSIVPPSTSSCLDRSPFGSYFATTVQAKLLIINTTAIDGNSVCQIGYSWAPAPYFLSQLSTVAQVQLNSQTANTNMQQCFPIIKRLIAQRKNAAYGCGAKLPVFARAQDGWGTSSNAMAGMDSATDSSAMSLGNGWPVVTFCNASFQAIGAAPSYTDENNTVVTCAGGQPVSSAVTRAKLTGFYVYVSFDIREQPQVSPFAFADPDLQYSALAGLSSLQIQLNLQGAYAARAFYNNADAEGSVLADAAVVNFVNARFYSTWYARPTPAPFKGEYLCKVPWQQVQPYITQGAAVAAGATVSGIAWNSVQLSAVPRKIALACMWPAATLAAHPEITDAFLPMTNVNIQLFGVSGLLSSLDQFSLYGVSRRAGLDMSWPQWAGEATSAGTTTQTTGGFLVLDVAESLTLPAGYAPGQQGSIQFAATATVKNTSSVTLPSVQCVLIAVYDGEFSVKQSGESQLSLLGLTDAQVAAELAKTDEIRATAMAPEYQRSLGGHGGFLPALAPFVGPALSFLADKVLAPIASKGAEWLGKKAFGSGVSGGAGSGGATSGGAKKMTLADRLA
jgi:hypothetical protein